MKARRHDKLLSKEPREGSTQGTIRGTKRNLSEGESVNNSKKVCLPVKDSTSVKVSTINDDPRQTGSRGSANSRLEKLKAIFKQETDHNNINNNSKTLRNSNNVQPTKIQEKHTFSSPPKKNLANERLNRVKNRYSQESNEKTPTNNKNVSVIDLTTPECSRTILSTQKRRSSSSNSSCGSTLVGSPLAERLSTIKKSKNITVRDQVPKRYDAVRECFPKELEITVPSESSASSCVRSSLSQRLFKIYNEGKDSRNSNVGKSEKRFVKMNSSEMDTLPPQPLSTEHPLTEHRCIDCLKKSTTAQWINAHQCQNRETDVDNSISDSLLVNVDDTVLNKTDLQDPEDCSMEWDDSEKAETPVVTTPVPVEKAKENVICVVADTNVFLHNLNKVKELMDGRFPGSKKVIVYVPWMVTSELDYQKDHAREPLRSIALGAIRYINLCLRANQEPKKLIGQSVIEMAEQKDVGSDPDDKILSCAMQAAEKYEIVFLLSNDINLRNKAMINKIAACTPNDVLAKVKTKLTIKTKANTMMQKLSVMCSDIICQCAHEAYGDTWRKMHLLSTPAPWSFYECLKRFRKYWVAVFREKLLKQCSKTIDDLIKLMDDNNRTFCDDSEEFNQFMKAVLDLCVFLKDMKQFKGSVQNTVNELLKIASE